MTDDDTFKACEKYGAQRVYDAAYARMVGHDLPRLREVGLPEIVDLGEARTILRIAYGCLRVENQAAGVADAAVPPTPR